MFIKRQLWVATAGVFAIAGAMVSFAANQQEQELIDRIKPVGEVCVQGSTDKACAAPAPAVASAPRSGADVYAGACVACHSAGVAGAPKIGVAADWTARIAQGEETLVGNAVNGIRGMPPMGTCMTCSKEEIKLAVEHMVAASQ